MRALTPPWCGAPPTLTPRKSTRTRTERPHAEPRAVALLAGRCARCPRAPHTRALRRRRWARPSASSHRPRTHERCAELQQERGLVDGQRSRLDAQLRHAARHAVRQDDRVVHRVRLGRDLRDLRGDAGQRVESCAPLTRTACVSRGERRGGGDGERARQPRFARFFAHAFARVFLSSTRPRRRFSLSTARATAASCAVLYAAVELCFVGV